MKSLYALIALALLALVGVWVMRVGPETAQPRAGPVETPEDVHDPVRAGDETPEGFRQLLPRDAILPVYNPTFVEARAIDWSNDTLVIGLTLDGDAKAYPVRFLNRREMVIDWIAGTPVLVSW